MSDLKSVLTCMSRKYQHTDWLKRFCGKKSDTILDPFQIQACGSPKANFQWLTWRRKEVKVNLPLFPAIKGGRLKLFGSTPLFSLGRFKGGSWKSASASNSASPHHHRQCYKESPSDRRMHEISVLLSPPVLFSTSLIRCLIAVPESSCCTTVRRIVGFCLFLSFMLLLKINDYDTNQVFTGWMENYSTCNIMLEWGQLKFLA